MPTILGFAGLEVLAPKRDPCAGGLGKAPTEMQAMAAASSLGSICVQWAAGKKRSPHLVRVN